MFLRLVVIFVVTPCILVIARPGDERMKLPSYITACHGNDPKFNECAIKSATIALPYVIKGDKKFKTPSLNPLHLPLIEVVPSQTLKIVLKDTVLSGLEIMTVKDIKLDLKRNHVDVNVFSERLNIITNYDINGRILVLPITGNGPANMTFENADIIYSLDFDRIKKDDGKEYMTNLRPKVTFTLGKSYFHLENLFNGNKQLGDQMNTFLNENSEDVAKDLGQSVSGAISAIATQILHLFLTKVPIDEIFLP